MPKDIKIKEKDSHSIRRLDKSLAFTSRVKRSMSEQYDKFKKEDNNEQNTENSNATNYATTKIMRTGDRGARESVYVITGVSKSAYRKAKMKIAEKKQEKSNTSEIENSVENNNLPNLKTINKRINQNNVNANQTRLNTIKTRKFNNETAIIPNAISNMKSYQKQKLIKEKQNYKTIKEYNSENIANKANSNSMNIKTRNYLKNNFNHDKSKMRIHTSNELMKKSKLQNIKQNSIRIKNITQKTGKAIINVARKQYNGLKGIVMLIASGGGIVLVILIIILLIAGIFGSAFGFFFSNETPKTEENISVNSAVNFLDNEIDEEISRIKATTYYDTVRIDNRSVAWREVLSVYTVITTNRENKFNIMEINNYNYQKLSEIFWEVVDVEHYTEKYTVRVVTKDKNGNTVTKTKTRTRLIINVRVMDLEEMMEHYNMSEAEKKQVEEMMNEKYDEMWDEILMN